MMDLAKLFVLIEFLPKIATYYQYIKRGVLSGEVFSISLIFHMNFLFSKVNITNKV